MVCETETFAGRFVWFCYADWQLSELSGKCKLCCCWLAGVAMLHASSPLGVQQQQAAAV